MIATSNKLEQIMEHFEYAHLPEGLMRDTSARRAELAMVTHESLDPGPERSTALRKLLEGKDAAVRQARLTMLNRPKPVPESPL